MEKFIELPEPMKALMRGLEPRALTSFYGGPGTGKTNICLLAVLECVKNNGRVVFIDTEGGFSIERLKQLNPNLERVLERIEIVEPRDFAEQGNIISSLRDKDTDLIIVDSIAALYRLEYADPKAESRHVLEANRKLSKQLSILSNIAREKDIPVLVTTHTFRNWETKENEIIGGDSIKYWSKAIVYFERTNRTSERKITLIKHRYLPEGGNVKFMLVNEGIKPSGFKLF
ncbi:MAG: DNA repair and recombination protein RadB [Candidatus Aenigmarchaeota archaeon]|nr:DNA repair and recombination protein RadB [Candidatus Aenigmarchaeota archaeon]